VVQPVLLLADEPTGNLDPQLAARHHGLVCQCQCAGNDGTGGES
jgi:ABC-type ATPase involved in cell division